MDPDRLVPLRSLVFMDPPTLRGLRMAFVEDFLHGGDHTGFIAVQVAAIDDELRRRGEPICTQRQGSSPCAVADGHAALEDGACVTCDRREWFQG